MENTLTITARMIGLQELLARSGHFLYFCKKNYWHKAMNLHEQHELGQHEQANHRPLIGEDDINSIFCLRSLKGFLS